MSITKARTVSVLLLVIALCLGLRLLPYAQGSSRPAGTYTNMYYHQETGDVTGEELRNSKYVTPIHLSPTTYEGGIVTSVIADDR